MSIRLHVAKTYKVEYSNTTAFNYKNEEFHNLLDALGVEYSGDSYDSDFEISRLQWRNGIKKMESMDDLDDEERTEIEKALRKLESDRNKVIEIFKKYDEESEPESYYLEFSYF